MNEFIEQFIIECRDYVEQATAALQILENSPRDTDALDALFRALHTLKGGAGIVDFLAMERALHAAETALSDIRSGNRTVSAKVNADCLASLDQVVRWLDEMERSGELPAAAESQADALLARFGDVSRNAEPGSAAAKDSDTSERWLQRLLDDNHKVRAEAKTAVRFKPTRDSFFRGEDPLALIASLPGLLSVDLQPDGAWPALDALDPYESVMVLLALTTTSPQVAAAHLKDHASECEIVRLDPVQAAGPQPIVPQSARVLLEAQVALLDAVADDAFAGTVAAAGATAANVVSYCALDTIAALIETATAESLAANDIRPLQRQIAQALHDEVAISAPQPAPSGAARPETTTRTLRIDVERVEMLVRLIGELTVVKNAIGHAVNLAQLEANPLAGIFKDHHSVLDRITGEVQRTVLGMRVLPLRTVLGRFSPVVREMAANLGKPVKLLIEGDETEADKAIVEMLFEPLLHVVRNAMDHGIESPAVRARNHKLPAATLIMRASRQGDRVLIEVNDDGAGIDVARVRQVAMERGVATVESLAELSEPEIIDLIFTPGFSTAANVTELSGRGVGMDAVRTAVGRIGGTVAIESHAGHGTSVRFSLPFSVMMTHVMTVEAGGQTFGIPIDAVIETIRVPVDTIAGVGAAQAIAHRNRTLPIFDLSSLLHAQVPPSAAQEAIVVVASFAGQWGGIRVDRLGSRMDVMLKPLEGLLSGIPGITGTTIMGDGKVLLVLDLGEILL